MDAYDRGPEAHDLDDLCKLLHEAYEDAAKAEGWETNPKSQVSWESVPVENKKTMYHAVAELMGYVRVPVKRVYPA